MRRWTRSAFLATVASAAALPAIGRDPAGEIREEFLHAWNGYTQFAWGADEVLPLSGKPKNFFVPNHSFGLSIIEAMDTLYVMGLDDELDRCVKWLRSKIARIPSARRLPSASMYV